MKKILKGFKEIREMQQENSLQIQELRRVQTELSEQIRRTEVLVERNSEELRRIEVLVERNSEEMKQSHKKLESIGLQLGGLNGNIGDSTEEFFYRSLESNPVLGTLKFDRVERRVRMTDKEMEIDILLINGDSIAIIEVKHKAHPEKIQELIEKKVRNFKDNLASYKNHKLYVGIASMSTSPDLIAKAEEMGIFLLTQQGGSVILAADK
ncbi:MAG: hypothetical protein B0D92_04350, partial [Spirochaeta sp. LUC14_002_19_P3]